MATWRDSAELPPPPDAVARMPPMELRLRLLVEPVPPEGHEYIAVFWLDHMISRFAPKKGTYKKLCEFGWFDLPVPLVLEARAQKEGDEELLEGDLFAIVNASREMRRYRERHEPWALLSPNYEESVQLEHPSFPYLSQKGEWKDKDDAPVNYSGDYLPVFIGKIFRYPSSRRFPGDIHKEAEDLLQTLITHGGRDAAEVRLGEFLKSVERVPQNVKHHPPEDSL